MTKVTMGLIMLVLGVAFAENSPAPCHPSSLPFVPPSSLPPSLLSLLPPPRRLSSPSETNDFVKIDGILGIIKLGEIAGKFTGASRITHTLGNIAGKIPGSSKITPKMPSEAFLKKQGQCLFNCLLLCPVNAHDSITLNEVCFAGCHGLSCGGVFRRIRGGVRAIRGGVRGGVRAIRGGGRGVPSFQKSP